MNWTREQAEAYMRRRMAEEPRQKIQQTDEAQFQRLESELDEMDWRRQACGSFQDPLTGEHHPASIAHKIAMQRRNNPPKPKTPKTHKTHYSIPIVLAFFKEMGLPEPVPEYRFCERLWRFDFAFLPPYPLLALEVNGGLWTGGAHVRGAALLKEYEKLNRAATLGYRVIFVTPDQLCLTETAETIRQALGV